MLVSVPSKVLSSHKPCSKKNKTNLITKEVNEATKHWLIRSHNMQWTFKQNTKGLDVLFRNFAYLPVSPEEKNDLHTVASF